MMKIDNQANTCIFASLYLHLCEYLIVSQNMKTQTEPVDIPGFHIRNVEVRIKDLIKMKKVYSKYKKEKPRKYYQFLSRLRSGNFFHLRSLRAKYIKEDSSLKNLDEIDFLSAIGEEQRQMLVANAMANRIVDHLECGKQLIKKPN